MASSQVLIAAIDPATASIVTAIVTGSLAAALRMAPKTRPEAAIDRSTARVNDAKAWAELVEQHRASAEQWRAEVQTLRVELAEEREECTRQIAALRGQVEELHRRLDAA